VDFDTLASDGQKNAPGPAGNFEDWASGLFREFKVERQVNQILFCGVGAVVVFGGNVVGIDWWAHS
jgi:hypothetical protein